jgi:deazaflavin-dependent oxidoreductase (nitroreductase family)
MPVDIPGATLADPPSSLAVAVPPAAAAALRWLNRGMVPWTRAGLGAWVSSPLGGSMVLLRVRGRRSGLVRETPLNYVLADGAVWVLAGFGPRTVWYRNLLADRRVAVVLPGRAPVEGLATEVRSPAARHRIIPAILRTTPLPSLLAGMRVWSMSDDELLAETAWVPLVRVDASDGNPIPGGPGDPGRHDWIWRQALLVAATLLVARGAASVARRVGRLSLRTDSSG